jgi:all-beta uncharacterized protein
MVRVLKQHRTSRCPSPVRRAICNRRPIAISLPMTLRRCFALIALAVVLGARPAEAQCTYSVSPKNVSVPSTGSNASISVITGSSCAWTATSAVGWITITSGAAMSGLGSSNYTVAPNTTGTVRSGTLTVAGQTVTITQAANSCTYSVSPTTASAPSTGSNASVSVTTGSSCAWTATSAVGWITITSGASMAGLGSTNYTVAANMTGSVRTGTLTVAGQTVTITQAATAGCTYTVAPGTVSVASSAGSGSLAVSTGAACAWTAGTTATWISIISGVSMTGPGTVNYTVTRNPIAAARTATVTVAGRTVAITQAAAQPPAAPTGFHIVVQ